MHVPPQHVMAIYDTSTKKLLRYIIPSFQEEVDGAEALFYFNPQAGEGCHLIAIPEYQSFGHAPAEKIQQHVIDNAVIKT